MAVTAALIDSVTGYRDAAEHVESSQFKDLFGKFADDRSLCVNTLRQQVSAVGGEAEGEAFTAAGAGRRRPERAPEKPE